MQDIFKNNIEEYLIAKDVQKNIDRNNLQVYSKIINDYKKNIQADQTDALYRDKFLQHLKFGSKILDFGCGIGAVSKILSDRGFDVLGLDISEDFLNLAKTNHPKIEFIKADTESLVAQRKKFDAIVSEYSMIHLHPLRAFYVLKDFNGLLNKNGFLYLALQEGDVKNKFLFNLGGEEFDDRSDYYQIPYKPEWRLYLKLYSENEIKDLLEAKGFDVLDVGFRDHVKNEFPFKKMFVVARKK